MVVGAILGEESFAHGVVEVENKKGHRFKVNGQRLKTYVTGDFSDEVFYIDAPK